jgi:hypothetical protein
MEAKVLVPIAVGCVTLAGAAVGGWKVLDSHWERADHFAHVMEDSERAHLETELELKELQLHRLEEKQVRTNDDDLEIEYLHEAIKKIRLRLEHLQ